MTNMCRILAHLKIENVSLRVIGFWHFLIIVLFCTRKNMFAKKLVEKWKKRNNGVKNNISTLFQKMYKQDLTCFTNSAQYSG